LYDDDPVITVHVSCAFFGLIYVIVAGILYGEFNFIWEWPVLALIFGLGPLLAFTWFLAYYTAHFIFAGRARYRNLTPQERVQAPRPSKLDFLLGIPVGIYLAVWITLLALQAKQLAKPGVQGSVVCLIPTLIIVLMHLVPFFAYWLWGYWGMLYRLGSNIPPYKELYGKIAGDGGGLYGGLRYDNSVRG